MERACVHRSEPFSNATMGTCSHFHLILRISLSLQIFQDWNTIVLNTFGSDTTFSNICLDSDSWSWAVKLKTTHHNNFHWYANIHKTQSKFESKVFVWYFLLFSPSRGPTRTFPKCLYGSQILCCTMYCLFCVVLCIVCV
jgi:hypothetical protein